MTPKHGDGNSFSGIRFNENGGLETVTTLTYGASGETAIANLRRGQAIRADRSRRQAAVLRQRVFYGNGNGGDGLPVTNLSRTITAEPLTAGKFSTHCRIKRPT